MPDNAPPNIIDAVRTSHLLRVLLIGFLILILLIPLGMIRNVIRERQQYRDTAAVSVTSSWGGAQSILGPVITVPYLHHWTETRQSGNKVESYTHTETRYARFLPETLHVVGQADTQIRYRGIFRIPVYAVTLEISGRFARPDFSDWGTTDNDVLWDQAYLTLGITDAKGITDQAALQWNGQEHGFLPGSGDPGGTTPGIHVPLKKALEGEAFDFSFPLRLNGSDSVFFTPFGRETSVELRSDWPHPSFEGNWLPSDRTVSADGFTANWTIPFLGRNYPQRWQTASEHSDAVGASSFGVRFLVPIDYYRMGLRSAKYGALFLLLTFTTLWLFEILNDIRIHPVQYLLVGAGMCVFYLLEISLAEHIGFQAAYVLASAAVVVLLTAYSSVVLRSSGRASVIGLITALLYAYLYVLLRMQDYALLIGAIGMFLIVAAIMYLTRNIPWYTPPAPPPAPPQA